MSESNVLLVLFHVKLSTCRQVLATRMRRVANQNLVIYKNSLLDSKWTSYIFVRVVIFFSSARRALINTWSVACGPKNFLTEYWAGDKRSSQSHQGGSVYWLPGQVTRARKIDYSMHCWGSGNLDRCQYWCQFDPPRVQFPDNAVVFYFMGEIIELYERITGRTYSILVSWSATELAFKFNRRFNTTPPTRKSVYTIYREDQQWALVSVERCRVPPQNYNDRNS